MKFIYGKQDFATIARGQENCYLITNGLGGFSSASILGSNSRNDHSFFMACVHAPNNRVNLINHLEEQLRVGDKECSVSSQEFKGTEKEENGYLYLNKFCFEDYPEWSYVCSGVELKKYIVMKQGKNTVAVSYQLHNYTGQKVKLTVIPWMQFAKKGQEPPLEQAYKFHGEGEGKGTVASDGYVVYFTTNGTVEHGETQYQDGYYYRQDEGDGRTFLGNCAANHQVSVTAAPKEKASLEIVYSTEPVQQEETAESIRKEACTYRRELAKQSKIQSEAGQMLAKSANQFVACRESTGGKTILAGYPFFEDWGRDTMIAMMGCCIATRQFDSAKSIFETFMKYCKKGIMPNLFPEGGNAPMYNTVDASLLFINAVYEYCKASGDRDFVASAYPVMKEIIHWYQTGTDFNIHMEEDGLIAAGSGYDQVTWMDVRIGEILPTPRHGKPVEINAYWYSALKIMELFAGEVEGGKHKADGEAFGSLADRVRKSFCEKFWNEEKGCLKDVVSGLDTDNQLRCNQIWAVSMPFTMLPEEKELLVVEKVFEKLYTPYGLRTLEEEDDQFRGFYGGEQKERDLAYHQGTVWGFPLGGYYLAYLKVHGYSEEAKNIVEGQLEALEGAMREGCIGQLPEIYDGKYPVYSKGCFAQAWSVGELLRVYAVLERI